MASCNADTLANSIGKTPSVRISGERSLKNAAVHECQDVRLRVRGALRVMCGFGPLISDARMARCTGFSSSSAGGGCLRLALAAHFVATWATFLSVATRGCAARVFILVGSFPVITI